MPTELTPQTVAQIRHWVILLETSETAPAWDPTARQRTPEALRSAAWWLVANGHAPQLSHELVCVLLALYTVELCGAVGGGEFIPRDAA